MKKATHTILFFFFEFSNFQLGLVCFRLVGSDKLNELLWSNINASGKLYMVPAFANNKYIIRFCVNSRDATDDDIGIEFNSFIYA